MSVVPGTLETDTQPPMTVSLRHFVIGLGFLFLGLGVAIGMALDFIVGSATLAHVHMLLAGWVCITIMGAMTQFVPVWSGVALYSRRLAAIQLWLVVIGLLGFAGSLLTSRFGLLAVFGVLMLLGFWTFVYNIGRTLLQVDSFDVTEGHFAIALGFFLLLTTLGVLLAVDFTHPIIRNSPLTRPNVIATHATFAVYGAVLTTVLGALYQLGTMFTQTELHGIDTYLRRIERVGFPVGVLALGLGRLLGAESIGRLGGVFVAGSLLGFSVILARRLYETQVPWTPMLSRYAMVAASMALWSLLALVTWAKESLGPAVLFGAPGTVHLLVVGVIGFVVFGTLYHIVPFIIWVHRYSDLLGLEDVPMIDDLYNGRIATVDFSLLVAGLTLLVGSDVLGISGGVRSVAAVMIGLGALLFTTNMLIVIRNHSPYSLVGVLLGRSAPKQVTSADPNDVAP